MSKKNKTILYVITQSERGGAQTYVLDLATHFSSAGHRVVIAAGTDSEGWLFTEAKRHKIETRFLKHVVQPIQPHNDLRSLSELTTLFKQVQPDIVHLNSSKIGVIGSLIARRVGVPRVVYTAHGFVFNERDRLRSLYGYVLEKLSARWKDVIISVSEYDRTSALNKGIGSKEKIVTIPLGIDPNEKDFLTRREARRLLGISEREVVVGTIANLYANKGLLVLVKAMKVMDSNAQCMIIGEGPERGALEFLINKLGLSDVVTLVGAKESAARYLRAFDVFALPSYKEGFPYALLEAQAAGVPVVASCVGGVPEIVVNKKSGLLVPPGNAAELARGLTSLVRNAQRATLISKAGKESVKRFSREKMFEATQNVYFL